MFSKDDVGKRVISIEKGKGTITDTFNLDKAMTVTFDNGLQWYYNTEGELMGFEEDSGKSIKLLENENV